MTLSTNEGNIDRILRVIAGLAILALGLATGSWFGLIGLIPLVTGAIGWCPIYAMFGISTCNIARR